MISFVNATPGPVQWVALLLALLGLAVFVPRTIGDFVLRRRGVRTTGKVVRIRPDNQGGASAATIEFMDARRRPFSFNSDLPVTGGSSFAGAEIAVIYDPKNPRRAREAGRPLAKLLPALLAYGLIVVALLFAFIHPLAASL